MPDFHSPRYVHVSGGRGGSALPVLVLVAAAAGLLYAAVERVSDHAAGIAEILYTIVVVGVVAGVAALAWVAGHVLRNPTPHTRRQIEALTAEIRAGRAAAVPAARPAPAALPVAQPQPAAIHHHYGEQHLHLHGISPADVAEAVAARSTPQPEPLAIREKS